MNDKRPLPSARVGVHAALEDAADRLIRDSLAGITSHALKSDILTPWKQTARYSREVYTTDGAPDATLRRGQFNRVINPTKPHLNSVEAMRPPKEGRRHTPSNLAWHEGDWDSE